MELEQNGFRTDKAGTRGLNQTDLDGNRRYLGVLPAHRNLARPGRRVNIYPVWGFG